jgi:hypothetical protein
MSHGNFRGMVVPVEAQMQVQPSAAGRDRRCIERKAGNNFPVELFSPLESLGQEARKI